MVTYDLNAVFDEVDDKTSRSILKVLITDQSILNALHSVYLAAR